MRRVQQRKTTNHFDFHPPSTIAIDFSKGTYQMLACPIKIGLGFKCDLEKQTPLCPHHL